MHSIIAKTKLGYILATSDTNPITPLSRAETFADSPASLFVPCEVTTAAFSRFHTQNGNNRIIAKVASTGFQFIYYIFRFDTKCSVCAAGIDLRSLGVQRRS
jgi:hypothetical protein